MVIVLPCCFALEQKVNKEWEGQKIRYEYLFFVAVAYQIILEYE